MCQPINIYQELTGFGALLESLRIMKNKGFLLAKSGKLPQRGKPPAPKQCLIEHLAPEGLEGSAGPISEAQRGKGTHAGSHSRAWFPGSVH